MISAVAERTDDGIDEYTDHRCQPLLYGMINVRDGMRVRRRTHSGFVGEQASCHTFLDRRSYGCSSDTADCGLRRKGSDKNHFEGRANIITEEINGETGDDIYKFMIGTIVAEEASASYAAKIG